MARDPDLLFMPPPPPQFRIPYGPNEFHFGDLRLPPGPGPHPVVIVIHGGFWKARYDLEHIGFLCQALTDEGWATWSLEYRRVGHVGGGWPGTFLDVAAGAQYLRTLAQKYPLDLDKVVVIGHSAGGHLALWVAGAHRVPATSPIWVADPLRVRGVVSLAGVNDLVRADELRLGTDATAALMSGSYTEHRDRYAAGSPQALLPFGVRQVIVHGTLDPNVPYELGLHYYEAAKRLGEDITLLTLPDMGHFEVIDPHSEAWPTVREAVALALE